MTLVPAITDFKLALGENDPIVGQQLAASGYYYDPITGQKYYYDATINQWYSVSATGLLYALAAYMNPAPKQVSLSPGEKLKVTITYKYAGPAVTGAVERFCIGVYGVLGFDEKVYGTNTKNLPQYTTPTLITSEHTLTLPATGVGFDWNDIYAKISGGSPSVPESLFGYENALIIVGVQPIITEFKILDYAKV